MRKPRTTFLLLELAGASGLEFYENGLALLPSWLGIMNADWLGSMQS